MKKILLTAYMLLAASCASIHNGNYAKDEKGESIKKGNLIVSGIENTSLTSKYFLPLDFTFENLTNEFITVTAVKVEFKEAKANASMSVPMGSQLVAWSKAAQQNAAISDYNTSIVLGSIAAAGALGAQGNGSAANASAIAGAAAFAGLSIQEINNNLSTLEKAKVLPETHIYSGDFVIPPGLHAKKWIAFYAKEPLSFPYVREVLVTVTTSKGDSHSFKIPFRRAMGSGFQSGHPDNMAQTK